MYIQWLYGDELSASLDPRNTRASLDPRNTRLIQHRLCPWDSGIVSHMFIYLKQLIKIKDSIKSKLIQLQIRLSTKGYFYQECKWMLLKTFFSLYSAIGLDFGIWHFLSLADLGRNFFAFK